VELLLQKFGFGRETTGSQKSIPFQALALPVDATQAQWSGQLGKLHQYLGHVGHVQEVCNKGCRQKQVPKTRIPKIMTIDPSSGSHITVVRKTCPPPRRSLSSVFDTCRTSREAMISQKLGFGKQDNVIFGVSNSLLS